MPANNNGRRIAAALLSVAAIASASLMREEGFDDTARPPIRGDRCTYGFGSTFHADGTPVNCGEKITRQAAKTLLITTVEDQYEAGINACAGDVPMLPHEKAILVRVAYQNGVARTCGYPIISLFRAQQYEDGCKSILKLDTIKALPGVHCSLPENRHRKDGCNGLMNRREQQVRQCLGLEPLI